MKTILYLLLIIPISSFSQKFSQEKIEQLAEEYTRSSFPQLKTILSIPNDGRIAEHVRQNVEWCDNEFSSRGFNIEKLVTPGAPLLLATKSYRKAKKTVLVYLQIDGQPVDSSRWFQDSPYTPTLKKPAADGSWNTIDWSEVLNYEDEWRVFARSASDAKGPVSMFLASLDAINDAGYEPNFNLKVIMDFEEELGSPNLPEAVLDYKDQLDSDMLIIFDGPRHISNQPTLTFGARGIATIQLTTYGPVVPQHSGHFGNYAPNPALRLARLLTSMKDDSGRVLIPGYYDGIAISPEVEKILRAVPDDEQGIKDRLQIAGTDKVGSYYQEAIQYPSLNIRGMQSGWINDKVRTIIPGWARAEIDVRLVLESDPPRLIRLIRDHIENQGYTVLDREPTREERLEHELIATFTSEISYQSFRTDFDSEVGLWLRKALKKGFGQEPIMIRMSGGSIPISPFVNTLGIPAVTVPTVNRDNNQHSPNENLRLGNYREGIQTMIAILTEKL